MRLPGAKAIRAELYYYCGFRSISDFSKMDTDIMQNIIADIIKKENLSFSVPFLKELHTQIAVSKVFTEYNSL